MKIKLRTISFIAPLLAVILVGCANAGVASSWPGLTLSNGTAFVSYNTQIFAIDTRNGGEVWRFPQEADNRHQYYAAPAFGENLLVAGSYGEYLVALDVETGQQKWSFDGARDRYIGPALVTDGTVYAPNTDGHLYVLDSEGSLLWKFKTNGPNWTRPVTDGETVYLASMDHFLYALSPDYQASQLTQDKDGQLILVSEPLWKVDLGTAIVADPVIKNGLIFVGTIDGSLHAVSMEERKITWTFRGSDEAASIWGAPVITEAAVFFGDEGGNLYAVSPQDGSAIWPSPYAAGASLVAGGVETENGVLFTTDDGRIFTINTDKEPRPVASLDTAVYATPLYFDGRVVTAPAVKEALLQAFDLTGKEVWKFIPSK
jgi:outer membrane protein assembly factor BamB